MLLARSDWEESATWVGWFGQSGQMFSDGRIKALNLTKPVEIGESVLLTGNRSLTRFEIADGSPPNWYVIGLKPRQTYDIEIDGEGMTGSIAATATILIRFATLWFAVILGVLATVRLQRLGKAVESARQPVQSPLT